MSAQKRSQSAIGMVTSGVQGRQLATSSAPPRLWQTNAWSRLPGWCGLVTTHSLGVVSPVTIALVAPVA
jgi:hypothetical protein